MNRILLTALLAAPILASAQKLPQPSPLGKVEQIVGLTTFKIEYSRPSTKGRAIFGDLVPYGEVWRTGANQCTTIEFDTPIVFGGEKVPPGKYSLFTTPGKEVWVVILNKNTELWGADERKPEEDVLSVKVFPKPVSEHVETLTISFTLGERDDAILNLNWADAWVPILITADCTEQAMKNIEEALAKTDAKFSAYHGSARFCLDRGVRLEEALKWANKSVSMEKKYWNTHTLARAHAANGQYAQAITVAGESMTLAQTEKDENYVKMNREKIEEWTKLAPAAPAAPAKAPAKPKK